MATETATDVVMPQMGVSVSEGTVTRWLKQEGEHVEVDEPLLEISTDKVDTEVPSPAAGTLTQILVQEGQTVEVGTKLAQIGGGAGGGDAAELEPAPAATQEAAQEADAPSSAETPQPTQQPAPVQAPVQAPAQTPAQPEPTHAQSPSGNGTFVSPVVARIASEHHVDPAQVSGTGRGGRVTKKDILDYIESGSGAPEPQAAAPPPAPPPPAPPAPPAPAPPAPAPAPE